MKTLFVVFACLAVIVAGCGTDTKPVGPSAAVAPAAKIVTEETSTPETAASSTPETVLARLKAGGKYTTVSTPLEAFVHAAAAGDSASVASLAEAGINKEGQVRVNVGGSNSVRTALHAAAAGEHLVVVKYLVGQGASVSSTDANSATPLHAAVAAENLAIVKYLVGQGASVNAQDAWGETPLHYAAAYGNSAIVTYLLGQEADVTIASNAGLTPAETADLSAQTVVKADLSRAARAELDSLSIAYTAAAFIDSARTGNLAVVKLFVQSGMSVETVRADTVVIKRPVEPFYSFRGGTVLHVAAGAGELAVVRYLVGQGASLTATTTYGGTALFIAAAAGRLAVVQYLVGQGASLTATTTGGYTPLLIAVRYDHLAVVRYLVGQGASLEGALLLAVSWDHWELVRYLAGQGVSLEATDGYGRTVLHYAASNGHLETVKSLVENGASLTARSTNESYRQFHDRTALHYAAEAGHLAVVQYLVENGADVNARTKGPYVYLYLPPGYPGMTARALASLGGHTEVVAYFDSLDDDDE